MKPCHRRCDIYGSANILAVNYRKGTQGRMAELLGSLAEVWTRNQLLPGESFL